ncbi:MAG: NTP transferase domain-containing protein [Bacteroidetes bacterium]|nr:NTP transferase domain-containing protein [Bacteroidota bacterium]
MKVRPPNPPLFGLVLAGGFSRRMGRDKGLMPIGPLPAREHFRHLLLTGCDQVWLSLRPEQCASIPPNAAIRPHVLPDLFPGEGPLGALYSAFAFRPDADWFVLPCDLPNMHAALIQELCAAWRVCQQGAEETEAHPNQALLLQPEPGQSQAPHALLCRHPDRPYPEPLVGIWSGKASEIIEQMFNKGERAVFRILPKLRVQEFIPKDLTTLQNNNDQ